MYQRVMRFLRLKYGISLVELGRNAGVSHQYLSDIELGLIQHTRGRESIVKLAFEKTIERRQAELSELQDEYDCNAERLLEQIDIGKDEQNEL